MACFFSLDAGVEQQWFSLFTVAVAPAVDVLLPVPGFLCCADAGDNDGCRCPVEFNSTAKIIGIRHGDVIVSFNGICSQTMPKLEDYLLSLGWKFLERKIGSSKIVLKLKVYEPLNRRESTINLPLGFSCLPTVKEKVKVPVTEKAFASAKSHGIKRKETTPEPMSSGTALCPPKNSEIPQEDGSSGGPGAVQRVEEKE
ncbi:uncharacterized protein [Miscanthus floridulus]|uniref:uncharacterized protein n=1 Tax=Miscanthus floridulus TaxID=154761 RepID=UPI003457A06C